MATAKRKLVGGAVGSIGDFAYRGGGSLRTRETGSALIGKGVGCVIICL
jgi:hypothetical protein